MGQYARIVIIVPYMKNGRVTVTGYECSSNGSDSDRTEYETTVNGT